MPTKEERRSTVNQRNEFLHSSQRRRFHGPTGPTCIDSDLNSAYGLECTTLSPKRTFSRSMSFVVSGADIFTLDDQGWTALHTCVENRRRHHLVILQLLKASTVRKVRNLGNLTPLQVTTERGNEQTFLLLVALGAKVKSNLVWFCGIDRLPVEVLSQFQLIFKRPCRVFYGNPRTPGNARSQRGDQEHCQMWLSDLNQLASARLWLADLISGRVFHIRSSIALQISIPNTCALRYSCARDTYLTLDLTVCKTPTLLEYNSVIGAVYALIMLQSIPDVLQQVCR